MYILVVDDEVVQIETISRGLKSKGFKVSCSRDGEEALRYLEEHERIDLVLTDLSMPRMNGLELLTRIRQDRPFLRVILMTAHKDRWGEAAENHQWNGFIEKPFTLNQLLTVIEKARSDRRLNPEI